jgi:hypothetical protein
MGVFALAWLGPDAASARAQPQKAQKGQTFPHAVLIIRHAEKPVDNDSISLTPEGRERAAALARLFKPSASRAAPFPTPNIIFAARDSKRSQRPSETVVPLAKALGVEVNSSYDSEAPKKLAAEILRNPKYAGKTILISWHHNTSPELAKALGASDAPLSWKDKRFDRVWEITYDERGRATFRDRPQRLLPKDSDR